MDRLAPSATEAKRLAALEAVSLVEGGEVVGLGTGSTTALAIEALGRRIAEEKLDIVGIPTSYAAARLARRHGIPLRTLDDVEEIDIAIDGADEIDDEKNLIKGGGGAHTREKIIAAAARRFVVIADASKRVGRLGERFPVPVELLPLALPLVEKRLAALGGTPTLRLARCKDGPVISDQGNFILDVTFEAIEDPTRLEAQINAIPGVLDNGIFPRMADLVLIGHETGVQRF
ncbi:MAG: ribose-5-phosphate isomerase RpiA [Deltaproteobacteria bacterium]|nr:MAG: ribose-5-phosphate isomerase RpiA [Deltaproteobacteria bacterium]